MFLSRRAMASLAVGFANQQMVTAESVGANTSAFLTSISTASHRYALRVPALSGVSGAPSTAQTTTAVNSRSRIRALSCCGSAGVPTTAGALSGDGQRHLHRPCDRQYRQPEQYHQLSRRRRVFEHGQFRRPAQGAVKITGLDKTNYAGTVNLVPSTVTFNGTLASTAGSPVGPDRSAGRLILPGRCNQIPLWRDGWFAHPERARQLPRKRNFRGGPQAIVARELSPPPNQARRSAARAARRSRHAQGRRRRAPAPWVRCRWDGPARSSHVRASGPAPARRRRRA